MNIFHNYGGIVGRIDPKRIAEDTRRLWTLAGELHSRLGNKAYLLDNYLSCLLTGLNAPLAYSMAEDGAEWTRRLRFFLVNALDGKEPAGASDDPLFQTVKRYVDAHPLPYQERATRFNLYYAVLADEMLQEAATDFLEERQAELGRAFDIVRVRHLYDELTSLCGDPISMETLNLLICSRFQRANAASMFLQGMNNELLYALTFRDPETGKQIFQILLDQLGEEHE